MRPPALSAAAATRALAILSASCLWPATVWAQDGGSDETGEHPGWPRWCGKVYETGYPAFEPGGHTTAPSNGSSGELLLHVQLATRHSIYVAPETEGSFIISAALSPWYGDPYPYEDENQQTSTNSNSDDGVNTHPFTELQFSISVVDDDGGAPVLAQGVIPVNVSGAEYAFDLASSAPGLEPRLQPYPVVLTASGGSSGGRNYTATAELSYLPAVAGGGSATKIDRLTGSLLFWRGSGSTGEKGAKEAEAEAEAGDTWTPLLPYGYYGLYNGSNETAAADAFVRDYTSNGEGLNAIIALAGFADTNPVYDSMDAQGLHYMFDLRSSYLNLTETEARVNTIKDRGMLFAYWTADEPDGWQRPFDAPTAAQALIHQLDPYHPVALTLNCQDYYFGPYSAGGDILMADVYPIGINATFSKWGTACNATLGDCGCDNCAGAVQDAPGRWDDIAQYERWLGRWPPSPKFHNPQAFNGEDYWFRDPTTAEAHAMNALAFNRGITGAFAWTWPGSSELFAAHTEMAKVVTRTPVSGFLFGGRPEKVIVDDGDGKGALGLVDVALWRGDGQVLVSVVNGANEDIEGNFALALPVTPSAISKIPFGGLAWQVLDSKLTVEGLPAMSTSFIILDLADT
ncbi:hypothetical protein SLS62_005927 [Diatrype stigma]|uniref:Uncharacterized protein n=1 Tax=Diatrype stigma TaxID=117547 RepID=A0AAN9V257_9PEZI